MAALRLQTDGVLPLLPATAQRLLSSSPLEHLDALKQALSAPRRPTAFPITLSETAWVVRTLAPVLLSPDDTLRDEALNLMPPRVVEALELPVAYQLPHVLKALISPWSDSDELRLKRGLPPGTLAADVLGQAAPDPPTLHEPGLPAGGALAPEWSTTHGAASAGRPVQGGRAVSRGAAERGPMAPRLVIPPLEARLDAMPGRNHRHGPHDDEHDDNDSVSSRETTTFP